jgi:hypothetical protein
MVDDKTIRDYIKRNRTPWEWPPMLKEPAMTVEELRDALRGYDPETPVYFVEALGQYNVLEPVSDLDFYYMQYSHDIEAHIAMPDGDPVIVLQAK